MSQRVIQQLKRKGQLDVFEKEIDKKIQIGTLVKVDYQELKQIMSSIHHFCYLSLVMLETSTSTSARLINNTKTSYCLENQIVRS